MLGNGSLVRSVFQYNISVCGSLKLLNYCYKHSKLSRYNFSLSLQWTTPINVKVQ